MLNTTRRDPHSIGEILAHRLKPAQRWRPRPRAKRPAQRKPKPRVSEAETALLKVPGMRGVLEAEARASEARMAEGLAAYGLKTAEDTLASLRERRVQAYDAERRATSAAERLRHHQESERLGVRILEAEGKVREARARLADAKRQHEQADACVDMALRELVR